MEPSAFSIPPDWPPPILEIDLKRGWVSVAGKKIPLTHLEYSVLCVLAVADGGVVSRDDLINGGWGFAVQGGVSDASLDRLISRLRQKLDWVHFYGIHTVYGRGFYLANARVIPQDAYLPTSIPHEVKAPEKPFAPDAPPRWATLTRRELGIFLRHTDVRVLDLSLEELSREMGIAVGTLKKHLQAIYRALGVSNRTALLHPAIEAYRYIHSVPAHEEKEKGSPQV